MDTIEENICLLLEAIKGSDIYQEYKRQEENLSRMPELKKRVDIFRGDNYRLQNECEKDELFDIVEQLARESQELRRQPAVNAYLDAELALCRMMQNICIRLTEGIDMDTPDM